jgi:phosphohistidine phosphatase
MDLILWRHAEAEEGGADEERRLTPKGVKQAKRIAEWLEERLPEGAVVLSSPAKRAKETARQFTKAFELREEIGLGGSAAPLLKAAGWPKRDGAVLVVGHQPTLGEAAALALTGQAAAWSLKKGAIIWIASRDREGGRRSVLVAALSPDLL